MNLPIAILFLVYFLIMVRQIGTLKIQIWQAMVLGAMAVLLFGQISPANALKAINLDVLLFLFGMFVIGQALEKSGYLSHISYNLFKGANSLDHTILFILFGVGAASAFLENDSLAIMGTLAVLPFAKRHKINPKLLLLAVAFAVTIGSVPSPIGNPQNLLVAINGNVGNPLVFFNYLLVPTIVNLFIAYALLRLFYRKEFANRTIEHIQSPIKDARLASLSKISLVLIVLLMLADVLSVFFKPGFNFRLSYIAVIAVLPILLFSQKRYELIKRVDWNTMLFFSAMFILMESVWETGFFQSAISSMRIGITSIFAIFSISTLLSQLISNVPLTALYLPALIQAGASPKAMMALAAGSTIAGNLFVLGAASNVIIIQRAEKQAGVSLTFFDFAKIGIPLTMLNVFVYWVFLTIV